MAYDITLGKYKVSTLTDVTINKSVENLADRATITLCASAYNRAFEIESKVKEGDKVVIKIGYENIGALVTEFEGYIESIETDNGSIKIQCEDELYQFRKELKNVELSGVSLKGLLKHVNSEMGGGYKLDCDYDFKYDKFTIHNATAYDVLKKVQEETKANIYLMGKTLHVHPQYSQVKGNVIYDFAKNIEKSDLKYKDAKKRKFLCEVQAKGADGKMIKVTRGTTGGDKFTITVNGVTDIKSLERRADEELKLKNYTGYEGSFTGWLIPYVEPTMIAELRDDDYAYKTGKYYVLAVETAFTASGGKRKITLGKRVDYNVGNNNRVQQGGRS